MEVLPICSISRWGVLCLFTGGAALLGLLFPSIEGWIWMWLLAAALWAGFKWMNYAVAGGREKVSPLFALWIGTDPKAFGVGLEVADCHRRKISHLTLPVDCRDALAFTTIGAILVGLVLPRVTHTLVMGWIGVAAMLCLFHFGLFAILAMGWNHLGVAVAPIMRAPWMATSLADFWGPRWNRAFSDWGRVWIFRPLYRRFGIAQGTVAGFLASGLAHEIVVSLPARAGFGLPTIYFLLQGIGVLIQRRFEALSGRPATLLAVLLPAPLLFHRPFIENVFAPMIETLLTALQLK